VNEKQRVLLTGAVVRGRFLVRMCVLSFRTHEDRILQALEDIGQSLTELDHADGARPPASDADGGNSWHTRAR
jgi:hypothetical protein